MATTKELLLIPTPGSKPEYLADIQVVNPSPAVLKLWQGISESKLILEGYTKDPWGLRMPQQITIESTDGRQKMPGFLKYLKQRQKCAYGRYGTMGVIVISHQQQPMTENRISIGITADFTKIPKCPLQPKRSKPNTKIKAPSSSVGTGPPKKKSGGLLGKLVGAQQRTDEHVANATRRPVASAAAASANGKTAQDVLNEFRQSCNNQMLDFDLSPQESIQIPIVLTKITQDLQDKAAVTMDVLKYMVYEAAEEVNDEWIAYKEPNGFMDEIVITIYKEGAAPPEVLEEINKGDLPDEVLGQQRAIAQELQKNAQQAQSKQKIALEREAHAQKEEDLSTLNTNKRDRRTIEDYEREKKQRTS